MRFIRLDVNERVTAVRFGEEIVEGEIQSEAGECGQIKQTNGSFVTVAPVPESAPVTNEDIQNNQLIIMGALADMYDVLAGGV